ncbi:hypothetical protein [Candidatus Ichthyocystis sparus]|nr:hypothetical protein [Candidatus Ichthyocystis sparus]
MFNKNTATATSPSSSSYVGDSSGDDQECPEGATGTLSSVSTQEEGGESSVSLTTDQPAASGTTGVEISPRKAELVRQVMHLERVLAGLLQEQEEEIPSTQPQQVSPADTLPEESIYEFMGGNTGGGFSPSPDLMRSVNIGGDEEEDEYGCVGDFSPSITGGASPTSSLPIPVPIPPSRSHRVAYMRSYSQDSSSSSVRGTSPGVASSSSEKRELQEKIKRLEARFAELSQQAREELGEDSSSSDYFLESPDTGRHKHKHHHSKGSGKGRGFKRLMSLVEGKLHRSPSTTDVRVRTDSTVSGSSVGSNKSSASASSSSSSMGKSSSPSTSHLGSRTSSESAGTSTGSGKFLRSHSRSASSSVSRAPTTIEEMVARKDDMVSKGEREFLIGGGDLGEDLSYPKPPSTAICNALNALTLRAEERFTGGPFPTLVHLLIGALRYMCREVLEDKALLKIIMGCESICESKVSNGEFDHILCKATPATEQKITGEVARLLLSPDDTNSVHFYMLTATNLCWNRHCKAVTRMASVLADHMLSTSGAARGSSITDMTSAVAIVEELQSILTSDTAAHIELDVKFKYHADGSFKGASVRKARIILGYLDV